MSSVTLIISVSVIILLIYIVFSLLRRKSYIGSITNALTAVSVPVTPNSSPAASYSIWIYISEWNTEEKKIFLRPGFITLSLETNTNKLNILLNGSTGISYDTFPNYYYNGGTSYYYASDENCEMICGGDTTCKGYNFYKKKPDIYTTLSSVYKTSYTDEGCGIFTDDNIENSLLNNEFGGTSYNSASYLKIKSTPEKYIIDTFIPLQEWVYITVNMDTHYTEIYINGKLVKTIINTNKTHTGATAYLSPDNKGFIGYNSKFVATNKSLTTQEIWNNYKSGFGYYSSLSDYSVKVSLYKD